ncbi:hypothetical protein BBAD15_g8148 [Beauveria bassiana D1-5]|uniref:Uncharacterized protein n=1 Tax=Beauveria bassiana D1-5 TaxID=1245745 RepID=A0A0A2W0L6_BEABA|nr:hypothetical protein BBAD15_g8148 [Beauveria bassiana D1-5]
MAPRVNDYHILPTMMHKGDLCIGHLISSIKDLIIINDGDNEIVTFDEHRIKASHMFNVSITAQAASSGGAGFFADAASAVFGGKMRLSSKTQSSNRYFIPEMHGLQITLGKSDFLKAVECSAAVQKHLAQYGGYLYMITGLRFCNQKSVMVRRDGGLEMQNELGLDCGPVTVGPRMHWARGSVSSQEMAEVADVIFAIKVTKLKYRRRSIIVGKEHLVAKGYYHGAELVGGGNAKPALEKADAFDVDVEEDFDGEDVEGSWKVEPDVNWIASE